MFRWTAGTKARADRASRQHGYPGGPARILTRSFHPRPSDAATPSSAAAGTSTGVATASRSLAHSDTERVHTLPTAAQPLAAVFNDAVADAAVGTNGAVRGTGIERAGQVSTGPLSATTEISSPTLDAFANEGRIEEDGERGNTLRGTAADVASSAFQAPSLSDNGSAAPPSLSSPLPSPLRDVVANHGGDSSEHPPSASSSFRSKVIPTKHQPLLPPSPPLPERLACCYRTLPLPALPSSWHASSAAHAERLLEALEVQAAPQRARRHTLGGSSPHQRAWRQRDKRYRRGEALHDCSRDANGLVESSEEEVADTYAKVQEQRQRQLEEKQAGGEREPSSSVDDFLDSSLHHESQIAQCREQRRRRRSGHRATEQSVDCIAVQLPLQRAKDAPAPAKTHTTVVSSPRAYPEAHSSSSVTAEERRHVPLACADQREAQGSFVQEDAHSLPGGMAVEIAADIFRRDSCSSPAATGDETTLSGGAGGHLSHMLATSPGCPAEHVGSSHVTEEGLLPWHAALPSVTATLPMKCSQHVVASVFEDQPLSWYQQQGVQAKQHVFGEYASAVDYEDRPEADDQRRCGVASLLGSDWSAAEPASAFAAMPARGGDATLWVPEAEPLSFASWRQLESNCDAYAGTYDVPADRVMAPRGDLTLDLGGACAGFYGGNTHGSSWLLSPADNACCTSKDGSDWQQQVARCSAAPMRLSHASAMLGSRGISAEAPLFRDLLSSYAAPRELATGSALPWMAADEGESGAGVRGGGKDGDRIFLGRAPSPLLPRYSPGGAPGSRCGRGNEDGGIGAFYPAQALLPPPDDCRRPLQSQTHSLPCFGMPFSSVESVSGNTTSAAAPAPHGAGRAARQRLRRSDGARPPRALNGTTERCRRFWERCRQSKMPNL
ncbi:hypothetical protein LSCM4_05190 [Leishmania orientalis]|uniref:Uncharacterized protein n=1 Tax=Leishmania orientalis TaxID=2249476 RepID=A0A836KJ65_9TRYP|nr:hypothetical protein LSCM4_05190 [Leishmania orientalis]